MKTLANTAAAPSFANTAITASQKMKARAKLRALNVDTSNVKSDADLLAAMHSAGIFWEIMGTLPAEPAAIDPVPAEPDTIPVADETIEARVETPEPAFTAAPATPAPDAVNALTAALGALIPQPAPAPAVDEETLIALIQEHATQTIEVIPAAERPAVKITGAHTALKPLVTMLQTGALVYLAGPAGSGKTTLAAQAAESLGLDFYAHGSILAPYEVLGTLDAHGNYHETQLYKAFKQGGVVLFDEIDGCSARAIIAINRLIERGCKRFTFPNGETVEKHPDFLVIAAANTVGTGATREYAGRAVLDGASLDRFMMLEVNYDAKLERRLARAEFEKFGGEDGSLVDHWVDTVRDWRKQASKAGCTQIISPRASISGAALLAAGMEFEAVLNATVIKGMPSDMRKQIKAALV